MIRTIHDASTQSSLPVWSLVRRVLLIRLRSIGDTVLMTPCLAALKDWVPEIEIAVLSEPASAPILEGHPLVDKLIIARESPASRSRLISRLRRERFDVVYNMHGGTTGTIIAATSGARHTIGYRGHRQSWMLGARAPSPDVIINRATIHSVEQQLALLHWSGVPWPVPAPRLSLAVSAAARQSVQSKLNALGLSDSSGRAEFGVVAAAAAAESKRWPASGFAAVASHLGQRWRLPVVAIAGQGQEHLAHEVAAASRPWARVLTGLSLTELIALLSMARVFVGNDSGPMHIAAALSKPIAAVFGSSDASVWHPWTDAAYRVVRSETAASASSGPLIARVPVDDVIRAVDEVIELAASASFRADAC